MSGISDVLNSKTNIVTLGNEHLRQVDSQSGRATLNLSAGDTVSGKIVSITNSEDGSRTALIDLGNNSAISAKLNDGMALTNGQNVAFLVRSTSSNTLTLSPLFENTAIDPNTLKALNAAGVEVNNASIYMVSKMMENGMSIDKASIADMMNIVNQNPGADIGHMVEMKNLGIEINDNNIQTYEAYKNYEHQVLNEMTSIMEELPGAFDSLTFSGNIQGANDLYGNILQVITGNGSAALEQSGQITGEATASATETSESGMSNATGEIADENAVLSNSLDKTNTNITEANAENIINSGEQKFALSNEFITRLNDLSPKAALELQNMLEQGTISEKNVADILKTIAREYAQNGTNPEMTEVFNKLFSTDDFKKMVKDQMSTQWLIKPEEVEEKENVEKLYNRLNEQTRQMAHILEKTLGQDNPLTKTAQNLQKNMDFMNELNQMFTYIQLPLKMTNQNAHGDLYVYANKKHERAEDGSVSAILHLDMEHLGPIDVYVKLTGNNVKTNFYVADDSVLDIIYANIDTLDERLKNRGYIMEAKMMLHTDMDNDSPDAPIDEMLDIKKLPVISFTSFDARA